MILSTVKILVGFPINDNSNDMLIDYLIRVTINRVLNYCNLKQLPQELELTVAEMTANMIKLQYSEQMTTQEEKAEEARAVAIQSDADKKVIKKETLGDYSVEYAVDSTTTTTSSPSLVLDDILSDYKSQLNRFRKIKL